MSVNEKPSLPPNQRYPFAELMASEYPIQQLVVPPMLSHSEFTRLFWAASRITATLPPMSAHCVCAVQKLTAAPRRR